jgi:signal peptidase II
MTSPRDNRYRMIFGTALLCLLLDQASKAAITAFIPYRQSFTVVPNFFDFVHVRNRGAAFGFLNRPDIDWQFWIFLLAAVLACGLILNTAHRIRYHRTLFCGFGLLLGGAFGNLIDRVRLRAVIDFLDIYIGAWHWPAFNVADMAICLGAALAGLSLWRLPGLTRRAGHAPD